MGGLMSSCRRLLAVLVLSLAGSAPTQAKLSAKPASRPAKGSRASADRCVTCHQQLTPTIVSDWKLSKHSRNGLSCDTCHGSDHTTKDDVVKVKLPTPY